MNETEKRIEKIIEKANSENDPTNLAVKSSKLRTFFRSLSKPKNIKHWVYIRKIKNCSEKKLNEHDMLQANQANLKCSNGYTNNLKQVININSSIHERYRKLQKLSLQHILNKGKYFLHLICLKSYVMISFSTYNLFFKLFYQELQKNTRF